MKKFIFSLIIALVPSFLSAQILHCKIDSIPEGMTEREYRVQKYVEARGTRAPRYVKMQFAGSIGMLNIGSGWDYGRNRQWESEFLVGFVPKRQSNTAKLSVSLRQCYVPYKLELAPKIHYQPLRVNFGVNAVFGDKFWRRSPDKYPNGYYFFSTQMQVVAGVGQQFTFTLPGDKTKFFDSVGIYYDLTTTSAYVLSSVPNKYLKAHDILHLALGLKFQIL